MTTTKSKATKNAEAIAELRAIGAELLKAEDRHGETKTGWWLDDICVAPKNDPLGALRSIKYGAN